MKNINYRMKQKMNEVFSIEPNNLGINLLTNYFRRIAFYLKNAPFIVIIPLMIILSIFLYFILGRQLIRLVTILQYGY